MTSQLEPGNEHARAYGPQHGPFGYIPESKPEIVATKPDGEKAGSSNWKGICIAIAALLPPVAAGIAFDLLLSRRGHLYRPHGRHGLSPFDIAFVAVLILEFVIFIGGLLLVRWIKRLVTGAPSSDAGASTT